jgi:hypothetical protein
MAQPFKKNTLNQDEKYKLVEHLKANLDRCNNKSCEEIAKFCNEELEFPRKDGKQIKVVAKHVDNQYQILVNNNQEVWTKKQIKKTMSMQKLAEKVEYLDSCRVRLAKRINDLEIRMNPIGEDNTDIELDEGTFDGTRDQQESIQRYSS